MGGNPSGRGQTVLLAHWLQEQVSACTSPDSTGTGMQPFWQLHPSRTNSDANNERSRARCSSEAAAAGHVAKWHCSNLSSVSHGLTTSTSAAAAGSAGGSVRDQKRQEQHKMRQEPNLSPPHCPKAAACSPRARTGYAQAGGSPLAPQLQSSACQQTQASWHDLLPQECESLGLEVWAEEIIRGHPDQSKRALGVLGAGYGLLVHQVAMHCFERGALMAGIWNMYTALMDAELQSLEEHVKVLFCCRPCTLTPNVTLTVCLLQGVAFQQAPQLFQHSSNGRAALVGPGRRHICPANSLHGTSVVQLYDICFIHHSIISHIYLDGCNSTC